MFSFFNNQFLSDIRAQRKTVPIIYNSLGVLAAVLLHIDMLPCRKGGGQLTKYKAYRKQSLSASLSVGDISNSGELAYSV